MTIGGMLIATGPGVANLQDYTQAMPYKKIKINAQAGAQLDQFTAELHDPQSLATIAPEDDLICVDASDPNGFPTVNLVQNPSFEGTYVSGVAPNWSGTGGAGITFSSSASSLFNSACQSFGISGAGNGTYLIQQLNIPAPTNEFNQLISQFHYSFSMYVNVTAAPTNTACSIILSYLNSAGSTLQNVTTPVSLTAGWTRYVCTQTPPVGTAKINVSFQAVVSGTTGTATILLDGAQLEYWTFALSYVKQVTPSIYQTAAQAVLYPTPFTDISQSSVHLDRQANLYYRSVRLFGGFIRSIDNDYSAGPERIRTINAVDYGVMLQEAPANLTINAQTDYAAIQQAVMYAQGINSQLLGGIDTTTFVQQIATIDSFQINQNTFRDVIDHIANDTQATYWVDYDKYLHYAPLLAVSAPFGFSSTPDLVSTFPFDHFTYTQDSTQSLSAKTIEGGTMVSAPQTSTLTGSSFTLSAALTNGTTYTSLSVSAIPRDLGAGWTLQIGTGGTTQTVTIATLTHAGATSIPVLSFKANATYAINTTVAINGYIVNGGSPLYNVTSVTVAGTAQTVGIANSQSSGSFQVLYNPQNALVTFATPPANSSNVVIIFTFQAPVLVRVRNAAAESALGALRRPIHHYTKHDFITSIQSAIDRGTAELTINGKAKPIGTIHCKSPLCPTATPLRPGQSVQVTHSAAGFVKSLFEIQSVETTSLGAGGIRRQLGIGYYRPDYVLTLARERARQQRLLANSTAGTVLNDVQTASDGWTLGDGISNSLSNAAVYGTSTYGGGAVYQ